MRVTRLRASGAGAILIAAAVSVSSQQPKIGYDDTPMQPNGKWHVHDGTRPQPKMVTPGATPAPHRPTPPSSSARPTRARGR